MKKSLLFLVVLLLTALVEFSCVPLTTLYRTTEAPILRTGNPNIINIPMLASHEMIGSSKVKGSSSIKISEGNLSDAKVLAVADAISKVSGCDQLLNPIFSTITENDVIKAEVTGFPIKLKDLRQMQISDTAFISKIIKVGALTVTHSDNNSNSSRPSTILGIPISSSSNSFSENVLSSSTQSINSAPIEKGGRIIEGGFGFFNISDSDLGAQTGFFTSVKFGLSSRLRMGAAIGYFSRGEDSSSGFSPGKITNSTLPVLGLLELNLTDKGPFLPFLGMHAGIFSLSTKYESRFGGGETRNSYFGFSPIAGVNYNIGERLLITAQLKYNYIFADGNPIRGINGCFGAGLRF